MNGCNGWIVREPLRAQRPNRLLCAGRPRCFCSPGEPSWVPQGVRWVGLSQAIVREAARLSSMTIRLSFATGQLILKVGSLFEPVRPPKVQASGPPPLFLAVGKWFDVLFDELLSEVSEG